jgi:hypothetical protein
VAKTHPQVFNTPRGLKWIESRWNPRIIMRVHFSSDAIRSGVFPCSSCCSDEPDEVGHRSADERSKSAGRCLVQPTASRVIPFRLGKPQSATNVFCAIANSQPCFHSLERMIGNDETSTLAVALPPPPTPPSWTKRDCGGRSVKANSNDNRMRPGSRLGGGAIERPAQFESNFATRWIRTRQGSMDCAQWCSSARTRSP